MLKSISAFEVFVLSEWHLIFVSAHCMSGGDSRGSQSMPAERDLHHWPPLAGPIKAACRAVVPRPEKGSNTSSPGRCKVAYKKTRQLRFKTGPVRNFMKCIGLSLFGCPIFVDKHRHFFFLKKLQRPPVWLPPACLYCSM
jgi:hypothetical protein